MTTVACFGGALSLAALAIAIVVTIPVFAVVWFAFAVCGLVCVGIAEKREYKGTIWKIAFAVCVLPLVPVIAVFLVPRFIYIGMQSIADLFRKKSKRKQGIPS